MGTLTLANIRDEVKGHFGQRDNISDARYNRIINLAQLRIARRLDWFEMYDVQWNTTSYTGDITVDKILDLPSNIKSIMSLRLVDGENSRKLQYKSYNVWDKLIPDPGFYRVDRPLFYTRWNNVIELWPVPDAEYTIDIRLTVWPTDLSLDADTSILNNKDDAIIMLANSWVSGAIGRMEDAARFWRIYTNLLNDAVDEQLTQPDKMLLPEGIVHKKLGEGTTDSYWNNPMIKGSP